jgi:hypothetical protein
MALRVLQQKTWNIVLYYKGNDYLIFRNSGPMKNKYYLIKSTPSNPFFNKIIQYGFIGGYYKISRNYLNHYMLVDNLPNNVNINIKVRYIKKAEVLSLMVQNI